MTHLSHSELYSKCPVAFESKPTNPAVSKHYVHVNTSTIIEDMAELGWLPVKAQMRTQRKKGTIFSPHQIVFQHPDITIDGDDRSIPQIVLMNSHDGKSAFKFHVGIFRLICSNGLVIASDTFSEFKIRHQGYTFEELRKMVVDAVASLPEKVNVMNQMNARMLSEEEQHDFAVTSLLLRIGIDPSDEDERGRVDKYTVDQILKPKRTADRGNDLWRVLNVVQEKMIRGGFYSSITKGKKPHRKVRPIKNFVRDIDLNKQLFRLATELV